MLTTLALVAGLALLVAGAELLVLGARGLGRAAGLSPAVIGLTIVAGATSAPELAVTLDAALTGAPGLAVGNAVGSNTVNALLVLGAVSLTAAQLVNKQLLRLAVPAALVAAVGLLLLSLDGTLGRTDGVLLVLGLAAYLYRAVVRRRRFGPGEVQGVGPDTEPVAADAPQPSRMPADLLRVAGGVGLLALGAHWMVEAARDIATAVGFSDLVVGLTVVSVATALPEIATSVSAVRRGDREMAVGNILGSNIVNVGAVLGITAVASPLTVAPAAVRFDIPVMIAATVAITAMLFTGSMVSRAEGAALLAWYVAYTGYLVLEAEAHDALTAYSAVLLYFCLPVTVVALLGLSTRELRTRR